MVHYSFICPAAFWCFLEAKTSFQMGCRSCSHQETVIFPHQDSVIFQHQKTVIFQQKLRKIKHGILTAAKILRNVAEKKGGAGSFGTLTNISAPTRIFTFICYLFFEWIYGIMFKVHVRFFETVSGWFTVSITVV